MTMQITALDENNLTYWVGGGMINAVEDDEQISRVTDSKCKPDITATFDNHWQSDVTLWPCVRVLQLVIGIRGCSIQDF